LPADGQWFESAHRLHPSIHAAENRLSACITMSIMNIRPLSRTWLAYRSRSAMACRMSLTVSGARRRLVEDPVHGGLADSSLARYLTDP
jgi:hypothetical protein